MNTFSMKRIALLLFAGVLGLAVLQPAAAQTQEVTVTVNSINEIVAPGSVNINIDPSNGNFTGTATTSNGYDVTSNDPNGRIVSVNVSNNNSLGEVESLKILSNGTEAPGNAKVSSDLTLVTDGSAAISNATDLTSSFTGVDVDGLPVQFQATVSPDFSPNQNSTSIEVTYTLTSP
ncbi:hypothetical protein GGP85_002667 [Salinibacter ruber]|uniref:hypothetical protein n=1 Tax=Salinibacter ruber TaxID=146919 RepID=UPI002169EEFC|nr:hypothetical protein [Salinibacter ruber]MCS3669217.1 hypothetical protein [Salinibacter ruber]MCS3827199.1 hypothetical protein [Salinibacter ruber]